MTADNHNATYQPRARTHGGRDAADEQAPAPVNICCDPEQGQSADEAVGAYFDSAEAALKAGDPPLSPREANHAKKGLPEPGNLRKLARVWLEKVHALWPEVCRAGIIPPLTDESIERLAEDFRRRFVDGTVEPFVCPDGARYWKALAVSYLRYSSDNSNPRSLDDQLLKQMHRAKEENRFIPWQYVFADASVTGRTHLRRGYRFAKQAMEQWRDTELDTLYFDDFSRASRSAIESYRLARLMDRLRKRLVGVSDGFDLNAPGTEVLLMASAMFNEYFVKQLRDKVLRGMKGAIERGTVIGRPRFGYRLVPQRDADGEPVMRQTGSGPTRPIHVLEIDPDEMAWVIKAAEWFGIEAKSYNWIARQFNELKVGGRQTWAANTIREMLACPLYIGVRIYNRTRMVIDTDTGTLSIDQNPRDQWMIKVMPELEAWSDDLWKQVRRRAAQVRRASRASGRRTSSRNELHPTTLLSGTLFCECGHEIQLDRSTHKYKQFYCPNGRNGRHGCRHRSSKSVRIVEEAVLRHVMEHVLTPERVHEVVEQANACIAAEASRPRIPTAPLEKELKALQAEEKRLMDFVLEHRDEYDMAGYLKKGDALRKRIREVQQRLQEIRSGNAEPPPPLVLEDVLSRLKDIRGLLNQNVEQSALALRALTGRITVRQVKEPKKSRATWYASINGDIIKFVANAAVQRDYPDSETWAILNERSWITPEEVTIPLREIKAHERIMPEVLKLQAKGVSIAQIAAALKKPWAQVKKALRGA